MDTEKIDAIIRKMIYAHAASDQWFQRDLPLVWRVPMNVVQAIAERYALVAPGEKVAFVGNNFMGIPIEVTETDEVLLAFRVV